MREKTLFAPAAVATLLALFIVLSPAPIPALHAQKPELSPAQAPVSPASAASLADRRKALNDIFHEYWEDSLKHDPEFASSIGDKRYNDKITDYSVQAVNDRLAEEQELSDAAGGD